MREIVQLLQQTCDSPSAMSAVVCRLRQRQTTIYTSHHITPHHRLTSYNITTASIYLNLLQSRKKIKVRLNMIQAHVLFWDRKQWAVQNLQYFVLLPSL